MILFYYVVGKEQGLKISKDLPKVLTKFGDSTYLEYILKKCMHYKINEITLATGHLHNKIIDFLNENKFKR